MNEEYAKHLMKEYKEEGPFELWMWFIATQLLFGIILIGVIGLCMWMASYCD